MATHVDDATGEMEESGSMKMLEFEHIASDPRPPGDVSQTSQAARRRPTAHFEMSTDGSISMAGAGLDKSSSSWGMDSLNATKSRQSAEAIVLRRHSMLFADSRRQSKDDHLSKVREAALQRKLEDQKKMNHLLQVAHYKSASAESRRELLDHLQGSRAAQLWFNILSMMSFSMRLRRSLRRKRAGEIIRRTLVPICLRQFRRRRKNTRIRKMIEGHELVRPAVERLKADRMLGYFNEAHLTHGIVSMKLRCYFPGEAITYRGFEDCECYVFASGTAEIRIGLEVIATCSEGTVVGSLGMVSGEPRTASIICTSEVFLWALTKEDFFSFTQDDAYSRQAINAMNELRQKNIANLYKQQLSPDGLRKFSPMVPVPDETLSKIIAAGVSSTMRMGDGVVKVGNKPTNVVYVLRGRLILRAEPGVLSCDRRLIEHVLSVVVLPSHDSAIRSAASCGTTGDDRRGSISAASHAEHSAVKLGVEEGRLATTDGSQGYRLKDNVLAEISGSVLVGLLQVVFMRTHVITVEVRSSAFDCVLFPRESIASHIAHDPFVMHDVKQGLYNFRLPFLQPPPRQALIKTLFPGSLGFDFLQRTAKLKLLSLRPFVIQPGEDLFFDVSHGFVGILLLSGAIAECNARQGVAVLWPSPCHLFIGRSKIVTRSQSLLEGFYVPRTEYVELVNACKGTNGETLVAALRAMWTATTGRPVPVAAADEGPSGASVKFGGPSWAPTTTQTTSGVTAGSVAAAALTSVLSRKSDNDSVEKSDAPLDEDKVPMRDANKSPEPARPQIYEEHPPPNLPRLPDRSRPMAMLVDQHVRDRSVIEHQKMPPDELLRSSSVIPYAPHHAPRPAFTLESTTGRLPQLETPLINLLKMPQAPHPMMARARYLYQAPAVVVEGKMVAEPLSARLKRELCDKSRSDIAASLVRQFVPTTPMSKLLLSSRMKVAAQATEKLGRTMN